MSVLAMFCLFLPIWWACERGSVSSASCSSVLELVKLTFGSATKLTSENCIKNKYRVKMREKCDQISVVWWKISFTSLNTDRKIFLARFQQAMKWWEISKYFYSNSKYLCWWLLWELIHRNWQKTCVFNSFNIY